jgi:predicted AlkP superfamily pyrophosphatase or phosphodiesterase
MAQPTAVLNVVGLSSSLIGPGCPNIQELSGQGGFSRLEPTLPAVTTSVQSSMLTGLTPAEHGIVGNGWYHRDLSEVRFWHRSNRLVDGEKVWETAKRHDSRVTCANLFWWYNTYSSSDYMVQVRPIYKANGRKIPDCYATPEHLRHDLQRRHGQFPLFKFWGPMADAGSTQWIVDATRDVYEQYQPTLTLVYLPHLDYSLQKYGPGSDEVGDAVAELDQMVGRLMDYFRDRGVRPILVSEYGIEPVQQAVFVNRHLREAGGLRVREEDGLEMLDPGGSEAFAVADHQVAHVYVQGKGDIERYAALCRQMPGVAEVLDREAQQHVGLGHTRSGDLVLVAEGGWWFTYDFWLDEAKAPDFARTVDINRKPGYDPRELFIDPRLRLPKAQLSWRLLKKKLGQASLMDVIALDTSLVKGSHGRVDQSADYQPVLIVPEQIEGPAELPCQAVRDVILSSLFDESVRLPAGGEAK